MEDPLPIQSMAGMGTEITVILLLIVLNGVLAMSEAALISARKTKLQELAKKKVFGAQAALNLSERPNTFLSTIQLGITLIGILAGAFGGATIAQEISMYLSMVPALADYHDALSIGIVVLAITVVSLIIGELVPKRIALTHPERIASMIAYPVTWIAFVITPIAHIISSTTDFVLNIMRIRPPKGPQMTEDELKAMIDLTHEAGEITKHETEYIKNIFEFNDTKVDEIMIPRAEIEAISSDATVSEALELMTKSDHSRIPVYEESVDNVIGLITMKQMIKLSTRKKLGNKKLKNIKLIKPIYTPVSSPISALFREFQKKHIHLAIVLDEHGSTEGLVTIEDILEEIVGDIQDETDTEEGGIKMVSERLFIIDGNVTVEELNEKGIKIPTRIEPHKTVSYVILNKLGRFPKVNEKIRFGKHLLSVVKMADNTIEKIKIVLPSKVLWE